MTKDSTEEETAETGKLTACADERVCMKVERYGRRTEDDEKLLSVP